MSNNMIALPGGRKVALPEEFRAVAALAVAAEGEIGGVRQLVIEDHRTLHAGLKVGRDHTTWIKGRVADCRLVEGKDFEIIEGLSSPVSGSAKARPQKVHVYRLTLNAAKEVAMMEGNAVGKLVRRFYIWLESVVMGVAEPAPKRRTVTEKRQISGALLREVINFPDRLRAAFPSLSEAAIQAAFSRLSGVALGEPLVSEPDLGGRMFTAKDIADEHGITAQRLGLIANAAGIPRDGTTGKSLLGKSEHSNKQVPHWHWNEAGKAQVDAAIEGWKQKRLPPADANDHTQH